MLYQAELPPDSPVTYPLKLPLPCGAAPMTVRTTHFALLNFRGDVRPAKSSGDHLRNVLDFFSSHVIELEDDGLGFPAVHTWMVLQVLGN